MQKPKARSILPHSEGKNAPVITAASNLINSILFINSTNRCKINFKGPISPDRLTDTYNRYRDKIPAHLILNSRFQLSLRASLHIRKAPCCEQHLAIPEINTKLINHGSGLGKLVFCNWMRIPMIRKAK